MQRKAPHSVCTFSCGQIPLGRPVQIPHFGILNPKYGTRSPAPILACVSGCAQHRHSSGGALETDFLTELERTGRCYGGHELEKRGTPDVFGGAARRSLRSWPHAFGDECFIHSAYRLRSVFDSHVQSRRQPAEPFALGRATHPCPDMVRSGTGHQNR